MKHIMDWANYYYNLGFNVTHIVPSKNDPTKYIYKAPSNNRQLITYRRQELKEMQAYDWENATGIGMVLGRNNIRAIDVDHLSILKKDNTKSLSNLKPIIEEFLVAAKLPPNYPWVVQTPSKGYHIIIKTEDLPFKVAANPLSQHGENKTKAFKLNKVNQKKYPSFGHFDLRWNLHLTLPPSVNKENKKYIFINGIPKEAPAEISMIPILNFIEKFCLDKDLKKNKKGYNLFLDDYHLSHPYTDFSTIIK
tara:strand:+ start:1291 stop:2040 length:750 start_codon:yes stop_codon:yes gene_type:complete